MRPTQIGEAAFVSIEPESGYLAKTGQIKTTQKGFRPGISVLSGQDKTTVQLSGFVSERVAPKSFYRRVPQPAASGQRLESAAGFRVQHVEPIASPGFARCVFPPVHIAPESHSPVPLLSSGVLIPAVPAQCFPEPFGNSNHHQRHQVVRESNHRAS